MIWVVTQHYHVSLGKHYLCLNNVVAIVYVNRSQPINQYDSIKIQYF